MDLFAQRGRICLHERVHVLPAVQVAHAADLRLRHRLGRVACSVTKDQALDVGGPDLAAVVEDIASGRDQDLCSVQTCKVDLRVAQGDVDLVGTGSVADAAHLLRVGGEAVLPVLLE